MTVYNGLIGLFWLIFGVGFLFSYFGGQKNFGEGKKNIGWQVALIIVIFFVFRTQLFHWLAPLDVYVEGNATIHLVGVIVCGFGMLSVLWNKWYKRKKWSSRDVFFSIATAIVGSVLASSLLWLVALALFYYYCKV